MSVELNIPLVHDCAFVGAGEIIEVFANMLRDEQKRDAFLEAYRILRAAIECYETKSASRLVLLDPSEN